MKNPIASLWLLLAVAFVIFFTYTLVDPPVVFGYQPKQSNLSKKLLAEVEKIDPEISADSVAKLEEIIRQEPDSTPKTILFIGDSMLDGLSPRLAAYCKASSDTLYSVVWYSSSSEAWGKTSKLADYIKQTKPDFIFISLGSNELIIRDIKDKREKYVKEVVRQTGGIPFLWIGPPNWKEDTGINDLIKENVPEGCYFRSAEMEFKRRKDGAHPTAESAYLWMDSIVRWIPENHPKPIKFRMPEEKTARPKKIFVHSPQEIK